jgi:hypothetical protein
VFVLGTGFSKAAHDPMPTLDDLGSALSERLLKSSRCRELLGEGAVRVLEAGHIPSGNVEMWLSSLVERQPFMSHGDALANQALFQEISQMLVDLVAEPQQGFWDTAPVWLHHLLRLWHRRRVDVITFNYDTIIELHDLLLVDGGLKAEVKVGQRFHEREMGQPRLGDHPALRRDSASTSSNRSRKRGTRACRGWPARPCGAA